MNNGAVLTRRETQIMELIYLGLSDKEIPAYLEPSGNKGRVSMNTVRNIIANIKTKLQVQHRTELTLWWSINHYHVSVDFSPLRRKICAGMMLVLLVCQLCIDRSIMVRPRRSSVRTCRTISSGRRSRKDDNCYSYEC